MIIKRLTLNNFGVYAGQNSFEFTSDKPIVLVGGMNGRGKTTFLEAILLALYGSNSIAYKESNYSTYGKYLRSYINKSSWNQQASVELEFVMSESTGREYVINRKWDSLSRRTAETITVKENGQYNEFLTKNWAMFIENILPSALSSFYFFDGEKIAELAVDDTNVQMKESIRSMLGISVLDVLKNDLSRVLRKSSKKTTHGRAGMDLEELRQKKEELEIALQKTDKDIEKITQDVAKKQNEIEELHHQYELKGGDVIEQRKALMQKRSDLLAEIDQNQALLIDASADALPLVLVKDLILDIKLQAEDEHNDLIMQQAMWQIEILLQEYSVQHTESYPHNKAFVNFVKEMSEAAATEPLYGVSDHALFQLNSLIEEILTQVTSSTKQLLERKEALQKNLDEVESYLSLDINEKVLSELFTDIREQELELVQLNVKLTSKQQERTTINGALMAASSEFSKAVEAYLANEELLDDSDRMMRYSNIALHIAEEFTVELQKRKTDVLADTITACYKKLANKKNLIQKIVMDPRSLDIAYLDDLGKNVSKDSLSAGEKQLMVIAILWALAICSKKKLPVIIDTPLSRLDSMHRTSLVTTYFPQASEQTIILSTDSEIDHTYYNMMKESVGDEFTLSYSEETKSTTILKGYFQDK
ncbi:DNA sulfur modification protein DndD [Eubacterium ramulus]|uniref:Nuclease SbcCD subunit C n=1 Tax=Eubacterium ramulus ATCC 29099 TaxID=1256908 RepID=U2PTM5_EUBRA|nr:DNA sulfur modification protein DndD [Eubacterium ramulus]ERK47124.1 DNA sulfur modification protein DndD [Eubacterium ramulus ATCC 29099]